MNVARTIEIIMDRDYVEGNDVFKEVIKGSAVSDSEAVDAYKSELVDCSSLSFLHRKVRLIFFHAFMLCHHIIGEGVGDGVSVDYDYPVVTQLEDVASALEEFRPIASSFKGVADELVVRLPCIALEVCEVWVFLI